MPGKTATEALSKRRFFTKTARLKYSTAVLQEFIENKEFIGREIRSKKEIESTKEIEALSGKKPLANMSKLGMKDFDQRAQAAMSKIKNNKGEIYPSDLQILAHLSKRRKIASDVIRELRDNKLSVQDSEFDDGLSSKNECAGFITQLEGLQRTLFPDDSDFIERVGAASEGLQALMLKSQSDFNTILQGLGIFKELLIFQEENTNATLDQWRAQFSEEIEDIRDSVVSEIRIPTEKELNTLVQVLPEDTRDAVKSQLLEMTKENASAKNQLMSDIRTHALGKLGTVVEKSRDIRDDLSKYLQDTLKLSVEELAEAQVLVARLEKNGGRKDNLPPEEWVIIANVDKSEQDIQRVKDMVKAYIMSAERAVDQFIAQRGNINVRNDDLRVRGIDLDNEDVKNVLAKLERSEEIDRNELALISKGVDQTETGLEDFLDRMHALSNNDCIDRDQNLSNHNEEIMGILSLGEGGIDEHKDLIEKLRSLGGMVDNLTEEEWEILLQNVGENDKDTAKEELIKLIRDYEEGLDEEAQPEYRKILTASQVTLVDDYAARIIKQKFRKYKEEKLSKSIPDQGNLAHAKNGSETSNKKIVAEKEDEDRSDDIPKLLKELIAIVTKLESKQGYDEQERVTLLASIERMILQQVSDSDAVSASLKSLADQEDYELESSSSKGGQRGLSKKKSGGGGTRRGDIYRSDNGVRTKPRQKTYRTNEGVFESGLPESEEMSESDSSETYGTTRDRSQGAKGNQPYIVNKVYGAGYGVGGYDSPSNIDLLLAHSTKGLEGKIEELKAAFSRSEAAAKDAATKAKQEIQDENAASLERVSEVISSSQQKTNDAIAANQRKVEDTIAANKKEHDDKMAKMAERERKEKEAKEREERRRNAMEPDWYEKDVTYEELEKIGHLSDGDGLAVISEIRGQKKGKLGEEGYFPGMTTYKNGSSVAVYDGKKGLEKFTREVEQSAAKEWSGKDGRPVASIARIDNLEKEGDSVFCLATASPSGTTKTFISPEIYQAKINIIADEEYEMALSGAVRINALTKYVAALKEAAEKRQIAQTLTLENFSDDGSVLSSDDDEVGSQLSDGEVDLTDNESRLSDPDYSPKEYIENEIARIEKVLNNMNAVYQGRKGITREDKKQYLEDMLHLDPMDPDLIELLKAQDKKLGRKLERLKDSVFTPQGISTLMQDATRVQKEFARLYSAQETNRSVGDMVEKSAQRNKLSVDLDSQEVEKLSNEFAMRQRGKGARVASNIFVPWNVVKGMKQAFDPGKGAYETLLEQPIQHAPLEGISILRPRGTGNIATVCFEGNARKDIAYLYVPETDYIISVRRAKNTGKVASYEGGPMVDCVANEIIIPKDTVFKLVDGKHVAVPLASLSKRDREFYDNFQVKAMSNVDGQRKMTTLFKGQVRQYNDLDKKIAYDIHSDQVIKFEVTGTNGYVLEKKIEGAEKIGESYVIKIGSIPDQFGNTLVNLKGVLVADKNNKGGLVIEGPYIEQEDGPAKLLDKQSLKELYKDLGVINPKHQKTFAEITREVRQTKVMATIVKDGQEHVVKLPITDGFTPSTVVKEAMIAGQMGHIVQNPVIVGPKGGRGAGG